MTQKRLAMFVLAGTLTLAGCGSPTAPQTGSANTFSQPSAVTAPAPAAKPESKPAAVVTAPNAAAPAANANANVSGGSAVTAPATAAGNLTGNLTTKGGMGWGNTDFVVFASNRYPNEGNNDIFVFDPLQDTVLAIVGVNTYDNEFNPRISDNGKWLVFQRTTGAYQDVLLYSMDAKLVNTLHNLNTELYNEYMPDVTNDGCKIVYVSDESGYPEIRLYDVTTGDNWIVPGANRNFRDISWPTISANGLKIAYGASIAPGYGYATDGTYNPTGGPAVTGGALYPAQSDIYVYDVAHGVQLTPPFINTAFDEYNPDLCLDGSRLLFVSNRLGTEDIFEVNLDTGMTDNLSFLNTDELDEQHPRYLGGSIDRIVFQIKYPYDSVSPVALRAFNRTSALLDTLPVANHIYADSAMRAPQPEIEDVTP